MKYDIITIPPELEELETEIQEYKVGDILFILEEYFVVAGIDEEFNMISLYDEDENIASISLGDLERLNPRIEVEDE